MKRQEPVAIVGIGCRYPGAPDRESFWDLLVKGREARSEYPRGRFGRLDEEYEACRKAAGKLATPFGGFLPGIDLFDAEYFGISPREAISIDPQHRLLLEVAAEALEDAGQTRESCTGSSTGVFLGVWTSEWEDRMYESGDDLDFYVMTGSGRYSAAGRLSYVFGLEGPSLTVDTACSSSLVAVHLACQSLATGESDMALAGGVNVLLGTELTEMFTQARMLAPDGRCKFGDASADGFVRSEGAGVVVLKRLSQAVADGDPIYAVIRGSAVNNDGRSCGLMVTPSRHGQERMIRTAVERAGAAVEDIRYVEAHGTGTAVGDPVEIGALNAVFGGSKCLVGSVKTNIGHTEGAAGVAGLIKTALILKNGIIPPSLHFRTPNPTIPWEEMSLSIPTAAVTLERHNRPLLAGVSSFGITGTNAHVILEEPPPEVQGEMSSSGRPYVLPLSAHSLEALRALAQKYTEVGRAGRLNAQLSNVCYTAASRRTHHDHRLALVAHSADDLVEQLGAFGRGEDISMLVAGAVDRQRARRVVFVFPGQGSQWPGMGRELLQAEPAFASAMRECDEAIRQEGSFSPLAYLENAGQEKLDEIDVVQPVLFAVEVSLARLWESWGLRPDAVVGHSMGEVAAAYVAGALTLRDAARVICRRSALLKRLSGRGGMVVIGASYGETERLLAGRTDRLSVGASNSPDTTVVSGDAAAVEELADELELRGVFCRRVKVDVAAHSPQVDELLDELRSALAGLEARDTATPIYSTVTGREIEGGAMDVEYWARNMRQPVMLSPVVTALAQREHDIFVEMSPHPILLGSIESGLQSRGFEVSTVASLRREQPEQAEMLLGFGKLYTLGVPVDWTRLYPSGRCTRLPGYAWQRERYWPENSAVVPKRVRSTAAAVPDYLYQLQWVLEKHSSNGRIGSPGPWVILGTPGPLLHELQKSLEGSGGKCMAVSAVCGEGYEQVLAQVRETPAEVVLLCNGTDAALLPSVVRGIANAGWTDVRLSIVTQCGVAVDAGEGADVELSQASFWGMGRVLAKEHPELRSKLIDVAGESDDEIELLARTLWGDTKEDQIALRGKECYVARYRRWTPSVGEVELRRDASYLITGGNGGVGLAVAEWMARRGAGHIVLTARREPAPEALERIRAAGAVVHFLAGDVRDRDAVVRLIQEMESTLPPLKGILHAAAVVDDQLIREVTPERCRSLMEVKSAGAWNLGAATEHLALDFFVLFSSVAAVWPQPGHGSYAAANASLDALAHYWRAKGRPAASVNWGAWDNLGLANTQGTIRSIEGYRMQGIEPMTKEQGLEALGCVLREPVSQVLALPTDWQKFAAFHADGIPPLFSELATSRQQPGEKPAESIRQQIDSAATAKERREAIESYLKRELARVLKMPVSKVQTDKPMGTMGLDSLMALEFMRRLSAGTGLALPATIVFNYPTIGAMTEHVAGRLNVSLNGEAPSVKEEDRRAKAASAMAGIAALSDEEALSALTTSKRGEA